MDNSNSNNFKIVLIPSIIEPINRRMIKFDFDVIFVDKNNQKNKNINNN